MPVTYVIRFNVRPEQQDRFLALIGGVLDAMRHEPMFHQAVLHRDPQSAHSFMLCETWESHDDVVEVQLRRPYRTEWHAAGAAADATADRGLAAPARGRTTAAGRVKGVAPLPPLRDRSREGEGRS